MRPSLKGIEKSKWERLHSYLLDIMIEGNEISNRMELYREVGRITPAAARRLCNKIEGHLEDIARVKEILNERPETEEHLKSLSKLTIASVELLDALRQLKPRFQTQ